MRRVSEESLTWSDATLDIAPPGFIKLINQVTAKDPAKRPATAAEFVQKLLKVRADAQWPALLNRKSRIDLNVIWSADLLQKIKVRLIADEDLILKSLKAPIGSLGPVALEIPIIADHQVTAMTSFVCGANQKDYHYINAAWGINANYQEAYDLRNVKDGDISPDGLGTLHSCRGIEVGHIFQLGTKYAKAMNASVLDEQGKLKTLTMGCYGLGISRVVAAAIEQHHDNNGIVWPQNIAPFQLVIIPINADRSPNVKETAEDIYKLCITLGIDVLLDDRKERPGVLFADTDLIGIPHRLVIGERGLAQGVIEYKPRNQAESSNILIAELSEFIKNLLI
jgi:prolyl-tRNA synthetase